jgi:hypothetical protein
MKLFAKRNSDEILPYKPTSGEQYLEEYFRENSIKYEPQKKIVGLQNDTKSYRIVDFYLPRLNVYVEYYGMYFSGDKYKEEYDIKSKTYIRNSLPTLIIYPNELGVFDFVFHTKLLKVIKLEKFRQSKILIRYKLNRYFKYGNPQLFLTSMFWFFLFYIFIKAKMEYVGISEILLGVTSFVLGAYYLASTFVNILAYMYYND